MFQSSTYRRLDCVSFKKTDEPFGGLSNMAPGFPLFVNKTRVLTSEHLYQASRFPKAPEVQRLVLAEKSPMSAKMKSKPHRKTEGRADWEEEDGGGVRIEVMRWCLHLKLAQHWDSFGKLLHSSGDRPIVEESATKDTFWGTRPSTDNSCLTGQNVLGHLLMELRERFRQETKEALSKVNPPAVSDFLFLGSPVQPRG